MKQTTTALILSLLTLLAACSDSSDSQSTPTPLPELYTLSSNDSVPEGVTFDPQTRQFYATSLQGGSIVRLDAEGRESIFRAADNRAQLLGAKIDTERRRLWVCAQEVDGEDNRVWVFNLESTELELEFLLGALTTDGSCNDLTLSESGVAYVTDPASPYLYRLDPGTGTGTVLATDPMFNDVTGMGLGLNGIALTEDESALIVGKFFPGSLLRVSLPDAESIEYITLSGDALTFPDGIAFLDGDLFAVSGDSVNRVRLNVDFSAGDVVTVTQRSGLSTATVAESRLYVIKSDVFHFFLNQTLDTPFEIFRVDLDAFDQE